MNQEDERTRIELSGREERRFLVHTGAGDGCQDGTGKTGVQLL